jgi:ATP/maltotriose-dependent transcriptional regulator MalT
MRAGVTRIETCCCPPIAFDLSQHTVKSQAMSIYHKLGVASRGQAVQRVQEIGLLTR